MRYEQVYAFLMPKLEKELAPIYVYHNAAHTQSVIDAAEYLGKKENVQGDEMTLLKTAALFHDAGFLQQADGHEEISCIMARDYLPEYGYTDSQIEMICRMIMATRLPQTPTDRLGQILCDADLFYIGKEGYYSKADNLLKEFRDRGIVKADDEWPLMQVEFLSTHKYFTKTAKAELEPSKQSLLKKIKSGLETSLTHDNDYKPLQLLQDLILTVLGVTIAGVALKLFLAPNHFFDGGVTGISLLIHEAYHFNLGLVILVLNLPLIIISYFSIGKRFAFRTLISVILLGVSLLLIPNEPMTEDKLLISVFGGAFLGIGIGLIMRTGAALDGIEVLAVYTLKRTSFTISEIIPAQQPAGTEIQVHFRGGSLVTNPGAITDADQLDVYGEIGSSPQPTFFQNDRTWRSSMASISSPDGIQSGAKFFQLRLTFVSNAATNLSPTLSALGFAWRE